VLAIQQLASAHGVTCHLLGFVGGPGGDLVISRGDSEWRWPSARLRRIHLEAIPRRMQAPMVSEEQ
jgi:hypothetical protein